MPKLVTIQPHLSVEELEQRYRQCSELVESRHYQIIWLLAKGKTTAEVASVTGYSRGWIRRLAHRYNTQGASALVDHRHDNPGAEPLLTDIQQAQLWQALQQSPADGGLWNSRKVASWIAQLIDRPVSKQRGWDYLQQMELRLRVPRPAHEEADPIEQEAWKKKLHLKVEQIQLEHPQAVVEVWAMDEHRLGLKPIFRKVWVPRGEQPIAHVHWRYQWLWLYGFVHPESGETYFWILPRVNITLFNQVLADACTRISSWQK